MVLSLILYVAFKIQIYSSELFPPNHPVNEQISKLFDDDLMIDLSPYAF